MSRVGTLSRVRSALLAAVLLASYTGASEFPERECCNHSYPISEPTSRAPSSPTPIGRSGLNVKTASAILNCLFGRQLCFEDSSCSAILEIIPRVCGPELVACSTVTVTKCQAALRTLQSFPYFRPTCLCREPHVDPECNSFRDFLFDHPCIYVLKKDEDPYLADNLLTCNHALGMCQREKACINLFDSFKTNCKTREGKCRMESRDACHDAWTQLRLSPMFGCICPKNSMKRRCDRIFSMVNHNPCVEFLPSASVDLSGTDSALYPFDPQQENFQDLWLPPTSMYPYFLFPGTATARTFNNGYELPELPGKPRKPVHVDPDRDFDFDLDLDRRPPAGNDEDRDQRARDGEQERKSGPEGDGDVDAGSSSAHDRVSGTEHLQHPHERNEHDHRPLYRHETKLHSHRHHSHSHSHDSLAPRSTPTLDGTNPAPPAPAKKFAPRPTYEHRAVVDRMDDDLDDNELRIGGGLPIDRLFDLGEAFEGFVDQVKVISHPDNSTSFELIESQMENPLIDANHQDLHVLKQFSLLGAHQHRLHQRRNQSREDRGRSEKPAIVSSSASVAEKTIPLQPPVKPILFSTCHHAYVSCKNDPDCRTVLQPILNHCDLTSCARNECMDALQHFYKVASHKHSIEIAFCLCKKSDSKRDECIVAQERMHPICAQRVEGTEMPTCHSLAEACREERSCRIRLEYYEQSCAVDSLTKKCAGPTSECRKATMGILGTELRSNCACKGTDLTQLYDCLGWQRLLWVNPCVVESQKDYHARRKHHHHPKITTTTTTTTTASISTTTRITGSTVLISLEAVENNLIPEVTLKTSTEPTESWDVETTTFAVTTPVTTSSTSSTPRPRFCVVQRPRQSHQYIREGKGKRLYREDEPECSELCQCGEGEVLVCNTICVESSPCKTDFAFYNHAAPAYQAYRGRCLCYSGRFICMRPSPDAYSIPHGVFMFLGYSVVEQDLLSRHSNLTVVDAVSFLDDLIRQEVKNETGCSLFLYNMTNENMIAVARLGTDGPPLNSSQAQSLQHLLRVKEECASRLQDLSEKINNRHQEVYTHPLLSIFKMAEIEIKLPYRSEGEAIRGSRFLLALVLLACFLVTRNGDDAAISTSTSTLLVGDVVS